MTRTPRGKKRFMGNRGLGQKRGKLAAAVEHTARDPKLRAAAASAIAASGVAATGKLLRDRLTEREQLKRSRRYRLQPDETPRDGIGRVARGQLDIARDLLETRHHDEQGEAIHEARKALKRLRAAIRLSRDLLGDDRYRRENAVLRDAGRALSGPRDAQVLLETLNGVTERHRVDLSGPGWLRLRETLAASAHAANAEDGDAGAEVRGSLLDARERVATWPLPQDGGPEALAPGFERIYRRGRRALRAAVDEPSTENLHELRKRVKDLWHAAQLLRPTAPKRMKKLARRAHDLSDLLGEDHDLAVLLERAQRQSQLLSPAELEVLAGLIARRREALQREALHRAEKLYRRKPRKLARTLVAS